ncbi:retrotransposon protein [Tanacetum coccineum]|uniref:Retrotransposon protein n=1 Tax=Tanacetum coccineum TaxID=301880 RepID=A0ABQ5B5F5_9ASTR
MTGNGRLFTSYKAYDGGLIVSGSNLKGKVVGGGNITHDSIIITNVEHVSGLSFNLISVGQLCDDDYVVSFTKVDCTNSKNGQMLARGHKRNGLYTCKLGDNSKQQICLAFVVDNSMLWHRKLGHANMQESSLPETKSSPLVEDDRIDEPIVQDLNGSSSLQVNVLDEGYPKKVEAKKELPIIVGYMIFCIETHTPFKFAYFLAKRMDGMEFNKDPIPFARIITTLVEFIKNEHLEDTSRISEVNDVLPMSTPFTMDSIDF